MGVQFLFTYLFIYSFACLFISRVYVLCVYFGFFFFSFFVTSVYLFVVFSVGFFLVSILTFLSFLFLKTFLKGWVPIEGSGNG